MAIRKILFGVFCMQNENSYPIIRSPINAGCSGRFWRHSEGLINTCAVVLVNDIGDEMWTTVAPPAIFNNSPETVHPPVLFWGLRCDPPRRHSVFAKKTSKCAARELISIFTSEEARRDLYLERLGQPCSAAQESDLLSDTRQCCRTKHETLCRKVIKEMMRLPPVVSLGTDVSCKPLCHKSLTYLATNL
jgi:hypothetical protein